MFVYVNDIFPGAKYALSLTVATKSICMCSYLTMKCSFVFLLYSKFYFHSIRFSYPYEIIIKQNEI